ncbi:hypothetical protein HIM_03835 [Hirsutella minnesotensis 3608]|uniref:Uncharacterized protein n=1 Tax=Hirsutella minnesotensis 3608 TaxID=1043627 RepID=A0A0F7ZVP2_9HYPO|nr:hypothetical protein HIM_03835 [Hirsutella minnesotensis 3608]
MASYAVSIVIVILTICMVVGIIAYLAKGKIRDFALHLFDSKMASRQQEQEQQPPPPEPDAQAAEAAPSDTGATTAPSEA